MPKVGEYIFEVLHKYGVQHAFGIPGDYALSLFDVLADSQIEPVVMTHEPCVGFAADVYARIRGLGVAVVTYCRAAEIIHQPDSASKPCSESILNFEF